MELLSRSGRIPSELIPTAIAWGQAMAVAIEAMFCQQPVIRKPPVMGGLLHSGVKATFPVAPLQSGSSSLDGSKIVTYPHPLNRSMRTNTTNTITPRIKRSRCQRNGLRVSMFSHNALFRSTVTYPGIGLESGPPVNRICLPGQSSGTFATPLITVK